MTVFNERQAQFHEDVRHEWTDDLTVQGWRKWSPQYFVQTQAATDAILRGARVEPGMEVLDIASGTGEPAIPLAALVGSGGRITAIDLGPGMLAIAGENARLRRISNIEFRQADVHELPFSDASFDRVTCRFGAMFFANVPRALREIWRVLRPGGRVSLVVWGTRNQPLFESTLQVLMSQPGTTPERLEPDAPQIFRYAAKGSLKAALEEAGLREVEEEGLEVPWPWPGPAETLWEQYVALFRPGLASVTPGRRPHASAAATQALRRYEKDGKIEMNAKINLATAVS